MLTKSRVAPVPARATFRPFPPVHPAVEAGYRKVRREVVVMLTLVGVFAVAVTMFVVGMGMIR